MERSIITAAIAILALVGQVFSQVFAPVQMAQVRFLEYGAGFLPGSTILTILQMDGDVVAVVKADIIREDNKIFVVWKGNLPAGDFLFLGRTIKITGPPQMGGDSEMVELPSVPRRERTKTEKMVAVLFVGVVQIQQSQEKKKRVYPNVPAIWPGMMPVPTDYENRVANWGYFPRTYLDANKGKLLTLDLDVPAMYCSLNCSECFRSNGRLDESSNPNFSWEEVKSIVLQAEELGVKEIKILGYKEPFQDARSIPFFRWIYNRGIKVGVFSALHVFGDDKLARRYHREHGIMNGRDLAKEVASLDVAIYAKFNSFVPEIQDKMVRTPGYTEKRNRGLELLVEAGLNEGQPTRLALIVAPVTKLNVEEAFEINCWGRERNLCPIITPSMCAGRAVRGEIPLWQLVTPPPEELIDLYARINVYNIEKGILTINELLKNGERAYAGAFPCQQVGCGMYVTLKRIVLRCPGDDVTILGDLRKHSLADIWYRSENYARRGTFNCHCPPKDGKTIPSELYDESLQWVIKNFRA